MSTATYALRITAFFALMATGQAPAQTTADRVFHFAHAPTKQAAEEIGWSIRLMADIKDASVDFAAGTLIVNGTDDQLKLAEWMFIGLDRSVPIASDLAIHEYRLPDGADNVVRLFYIDSGQTTQEFQEFTTMLRTIAEIRRVYTYNAGKIVSMRGTEDQMGMADYFANQLAKTAPAPRAHSVTPEYLLPADPSPRPNENATRILFVANAATIQDFQELATLIRTIAEIRRVFTYNTPRAIAVRGISDQLTFAEWLFNEIDQPRTGVQGHVSATYTLRVVSRC
jgi:hypothetical protein